MPAPRERVRHDVCGGLLCSHALHLPALSPPLAWAGPWLLLLQTGHLGCDPGRRGAGRSRDLPAGPRVQSPPVREGHASSVWLDRKPSSQPPGVWSINRLPSLSPAVVCDRGAGGCAALGGHRSLDSSGHSCPLVLRDRLTPTPPRWWGRASWGGLGALPQPASGRAPCGAGGEAAGRHSALGRPLLGALGAQVTVSLQQGVPRAVGEGAASLLQPPAVWSGGTTVPPDSWLPTPAQPAPPAQDFI